MLALETKDFKIVMMIVILIFNILFQMTEEIGIIGDKLVIDKLEIDKLEIIREENFINDK